MKPTNYHYYHDLTEEQNEILQRIGEYENSPEYKEQERLRIKRINREKEIYLEHSDVINEIKKNGYKPKYRKQVEDLYEKLLKTEGWPESWLKVPRDRIHTILNHRDIHFKYKEMREKGYLKKSEALQILSEKYGLKKSTVERIAYTGTSY